MGGSVPLPQEVETVYKPPGQRLTVATGSAAPTGQGAMVAMVAAGSKVFRPLISTGTNPISVQILYQFCTTLL
jgi:hypothetical protein